MSNNSDETKSIKNQERVRIVIGSNQYKTQTLIRST